MNKQKKSKASNSRRLRDIPVKDAIPDSNILSHADMHIVKHLRRTVPQVEVLTDTQIKSLREAFLMFDKDKDGIITTDEISTILTAMGKDATDENVTQAIEPFDTDGSGTIEFTEFLGVMAQLLQEEDTEEDLIQIFRILDQDGDGFISKSDLRVVIRRIGSSLTNKEVDEMVNEADKDGDGQITYEEFVKIITARS